MSFYNKDNFKRHLDKLGLIVIIGLLLSSFTLSSQSLRRSSRAQTLLPQRTDSTAQRPLPELPPPADTTDHNHHDHQHNHLADSLHRADSVAMLKKSSVKLPFPCIRDFTKKQKFRLFTLTNFHFVSATVASVQITGIPFLQTFFRSTAIS